MSFDTTLLISAIRKLCGSSPLWIAYSGGMDSHVLLHLLASHRQQFPQTIQVVHVNHQLQSAASHWVEHCQRTVEKLQLPFHCLKVNVVNCHEVGMESAARAARYQAISQLVGSQGKLLTGQHQQDQAETVMLQLLRGAGVRGLGAMRETSRWQEMTIIRPLLTISHSALLDYARKHQLTWIEDPSNQDTEINRNFLRHQIWPALQQRWPALDQTLCRAADNLQESQQLLDELAVGDLQLIAADKATGSVSISQLVTLSEPRQRNVLRYFMRSLAMMLPSRKVLQRIQEEVCLAAADAQPEVTWHHYVARRYQDRLYLALATPPLMTTATPTLLHDQQPLQLDSQRKLVWEARTGQGLRTDLFAAGIELRYRQGGEKIQLLGKTHHQSLKKLLQQWQVPSWQRDSIPLLFVKDELVAVVGYGYAESARTETDQTGWLPQIEPVDRGIF